MVLSSFFKIFLVFCASRVLNDKLNQFLSFMQSGVSNEALNAWREDMHWTLLLTGNFFLVDRRK